MVLAVAALLLQITPLHQSLPAAAVAPAVAPAPEAVTFPAPTPAASPTSLNLHSVKMDTSESRQILPASLNAVSVESSQNSQSLSTVRIPEPRPAKLIRVTPAESIPSRRAWLALSFAQHGAATFDAYATRQAIANGAREDDPIMRPFVHSPGIYAAIQVGPALLDVLGRKMQRSQNNFIRHIWWLPQSVSTAGFVYAGVHNLNIASRP